MLTLTESCLHGRFRWTAHGSQHAHLHISIPFRIAERRLCASAASQAQTSSRQLQYRKIHWEQGTYHEFLLFESALLAQHFVLHGTQEQHLGARGILR